MNPDHHSIEPILWLATLLAAAIGWIAGCAWKKHAVRRAERRAYRSGREDADLLKRSRDLQDYFDNRPCAPLWEGPDLKLVEFPPPVPESLVRDLCTPAADRAQAAAAAPRRPQPQPVDPMPDCTEHTAASSYASLLRRLCREVARHEKQAARATDPRGRQYHEYRADWLRRTLRPNRTWLIDFFGFDDPTEVAKQQVPDRLFKTQP